MTGNDASPTAAGPPAGPPWSLDLLADLHAGVFDEQTTAHLRARVAADPEASAVLAALDATRADLAALPPVPMPHHVAARIDAALRQEAADRSAGLAGPPHAGLPPAAHAAPPMAATHPVPPAAPGHAGPAPVTDLAAARERRRRRGLLAGAGLLTAAAAVVGIVAVSGLTGNQTTGTPHASPGDNASDQALPPLAVTRDNLGAALDDAMAVTDYGPLAAGGRLDGCLRANRVDPATSRPLGAREVTIDGRPGVLLILPTGTAARFRLLVVAPDCGPGDPAVLADATVGR